MKCQCASCPIPYLSPQGTNMDFNLQSFPSPYSLLSLLLHSTVLSPTSNQKAPKKQNHSKTSVLFSRLAPLTTVILSRHKLSYEPNSRGLLCTNTPTLQTLPRMLLANARHLNIQSCPTWGFNWINWPWVLMAEKEQR